MPVWSDPSRQCERVLLDSPKHVQSPPEMARQLSEESIRTELCDGPLLESIDPDEDSTATIQKNQDQERPISRQELIQRLKNEQSPTTFPVRQATVKSIPTVQPEEPVDATPENHTKQSAPLLLPAIELKNIGSSSRDGPNNSSTDARLIAGYSIARPRSALHAGNFTDSYANSPNPVETVDTQPIWKAEPLPQPSSKPLGTSPTTPHYKPHHDRHSSLQSPSATTTQAIPINTNQPPARSRAPSLQSYSSSFILKAPTSPLVQQANNDDIDFSSVPTGLNKENRRHTLPPHSLQSLRSLNSGLAQAARQPPPLQREDTFPSLKSSHRRSLGAGFTFQQSYSPPGQGFIRSRRTSVSSEASSLQHSMVGSYEESILRGRMSAIPSKPLEFTAQIGALGKGDCKYKHPAHVSVQFPAVFYSWNSSNTARTPINDEPSPYVGQIDLEHNLPPPKRKEKRARRREALQLDDQDDMSETSSKLSVAKNSSRRAHRSRSSSPIKLPIGGCYRIPQEGHLQILIKNPNKTAVKLFLVPYDLHGMEPGTKTFIRQKCYSAGPIIENPITSKSASDTALDTKTLLNDPKNKPTLRYLIHLQICSPSKGRFYLYKTISVVFANRVPDNKENLKNEIRLPEPRYSPYKPDSSGPDKDPSKAPSSSSSRRRSYATPLNTMQDVSFSPYPSTAPIGTAPPAVPSLPSFPIDTPDQTPAQTPQRPRTSTPLSPHSATTPAPIPPSPMDLDSPSPAPLPFDAERFQSPPSFDAMALDAEALPFEARPSFFDTPSPLQARRVPRQPLSPSTVAATVAESSMLSPIRSASLLSGSGSGSVHSGRESAVGGRESVLSGRESVLSGRESVLSGRESVLSGRESIRSGDSYNKLSRGDAGYGGLFGRPGTPEPGEGLLARKLRGLDVERAEGGNGKETRGFGGMKTASGWGSANGSGNGSGNGSIGESEGESFNGSLNGSASEDMNGEVE